MWVFLGLVVLCLTIIVLFRMYLDLRDHQNRHNRLVQSDARSFDKYKQITQQEALQQLTEVVQKVSNQRAALPPVPEARYYQDASHNHVTPMTGQQAEWERYMLNNDYDAFMNDQRRRYGRHS